MINQFNFSGQKYGPWEFYHENVIMSKGNFINNKADGLWEFFYLNNSLQMSGNFVNGIKKGPWEFF